jgi:hypothetical protein
LQKEWVFGALFSVIIDCGGTRALSNIASIGIYQATGKQNDEVAFPGISRYDERAAVGVG